MTQSPSRTQFADLVDQLNRGLISRREFLARGASLGVGAVMLGWFIRHAQTTSAHAPHPQDVNTSGPPMAGIDAKTRGQDGELKVLLWQAVTQLNAHLASGTKDYIAADVINEPLMRFLPDGSIWANLLAEVPTIENGQLAEDLSSVTMTLKEGITWSDGEPFTADDVVFTWEWITNPENNSVHNDVWGVISAMEATDDLTLNVTFTGPNLNWYVPFTNGTNGHIHPRHYVEAGGDMNTQPIGTGPFVLESFAPNDQVIYAANPNYREANKPAFARLNIKGGGEASTAAQSVLQTGDWDHAWNIQVEPEVIAAALEGGQGVFQIIPGTSVERLAFNFSDPDAVGPDGQRSWYENPHPILSDIAVRQAIALAVDRELIATRFYDPSGEGEVAGVNILTGIPSVESPNTTATMDPEAAAQLLEDAGWVLEGDVRVKDGVELELQYQTTINSVRQKTQQVVRQNLQDIGFKINLTQTDSGIFFDGAAGNEQNLNHMYTDFHMFTNNASNPTPVDYMALWYAGPDRGNVAQAANGWNGQNTQRYINDEYDAIIERLQNGEVTDIAEVQELLIQLNDILINDAVLVPLVRRAADKYCHHNSLIHDGEDNVAVSAFEFNLWNVANWNRSVPVEGR
ncbi:MAG TPA: peptide ABC transporter substrate-binding protein [Thermomicrobiales bacterium]|jgi:peptide/nickel transport system substrate-binding protein|nr:peptide ABC transporter substrate-binding protein [Thermomicrobiales bacterium]